MTRVCNTGGEVRFKWRLALPHTHSRPIYLDVDHYLLTAFSQICGVDFKHTVVIFLCLRELKHLKKKFVSLSLLQLICCLVLQPCLSLLQKNCPNYFPGKFIIIFPPRLQKMLDYWLFWCLVLGSICYMPCSLFDMSSNGKLKVLGLLLVNTVIETQ